MTRRGAPIPGILDEDEARYFAEKFGVAEAQVRRDHVISHVLAALSAAVPNDVIFFGGTALTRIYLTAGGDGDRQHAYPDSAAFAERVSAMAD